MTRSEDAEIVTLVIDGGTAYVLLRVLGVGISAFKGPDAPRDVLIHAYNQLAGQLGDAAFDDEGRP